MRRLGLKGLLLAGTAAAMLCGCGDAMSEPAESISDAQNAEEILNSASTIYMEGDFEAPNQSTDILADGAKVGRMEESGLVNTKWTVTVGDETWFYMKLVTDEPVNEDTDDYVTASTYGFYDANDNCLGYAQNRALKNDETTDYYFYFMDAEQNLKDYRMEENGEYFIDADGNVIAEAESGSDWGSGCYIQIDMAEDCDTQIDFTDKLVMYDQQFDELNFRYGN